jgi:hypothetical protein
MKVSYLIPTNRNYEEFLYKTIDSIRKFSSDFEYEILVYSKQYIEMPNVVWVQENEDKGPIYGFNKMCKICNGEYIVCLTDDHVLDGPIKNTLDYLDSKINESEMVICSLNPGGIGCFNPVKNQILGDKPIEIDIPLFPLIRFPVINKKSLSLLDNVIFNENLFYHAGDIWLGFYVGYKYGARFDGPTVIKPHNPQKNSTYEVEDCNIVRELIYKLLTNNDLPYNSNL